MSSKSKAVKKGEGWVYVATHEGHKDVVKIGHSKDVAARMQELAGASLYPFVAEYRVLVSNAYLIEQETHKFLKKKRVKENREWFSCTVKESQDAIVEVTKQKGIDIELAKQVEVESKQKSSKTKNVKPSNSKVKTRPSFIKELFPNLESDNEEKESAAYLERMNLATQGNLTAQYELALMYQLGEGIKKDTEKSIEWYEKCAKQGHIKSQVNLGRILCAISVYSNHVKAMTWFKKAAEQGNVDAYYYLGEMYQHGHGEKKDLKQAENYYIKAIENGDDEMKRKVIRACFKQK